MRLRSQQAFGLFNANLRGDFLQSKLRSQMLSATTPKRHLLYHTQKLVDIHIGIAERALESVAIHFVVVWENDGSTIGVFHFHVAAFALELHEIKSLQCGQDLSSGQQR